MTTPWVSPPTWALGNTPTATDLNNLLRDNMNHLGTPPFCQVTNSAGVSMTNITNTRITFDTENIKTDASMHSNSTNTGRLVVPTGLGGRYCMSCNVTFAPNASGVIRHVILYKNGSLLFVLAQSTVISASYGAVCNGAMDLAAVAGDYFEIFGYQDSGGALNVQAASIFSFVKMSN